MPTPETGPSPSPRRTRSCRCGSSCRRGRRVRRTRSRVRRPPRPPSSTAHRRRTRSIDCLGKRTDRSRSSSLPAPQVRCRASNGRTTPSSHRDRPHTRRAFRPVPMPHWGSRARRVERSQEVSLRIAQARGPLAVPAASSRRAAIRSLHQQPKAPKPRAPGASAASAQLTPNRVRSCLRARGAHRRGHAIGASNHAAGIV